MSETKDNVITITVNEEEEKEVAARLLEKDPPEIAKVLAYSDFTMSNYYHLLLVMQYEIGAARQALFYTFIAEQMHSYETDGWCQFSAHYGVVVRNDKLVLHFQRHSGGCRKVTLCNKGDEYIYTIKKISYDDFRKALHVDCKTEVADDGLSCDVCGSLS